MASKPFLPIVLGIDGHLVLDIRAEEELRVVMAIMELVKATPEGLNNGTIDKVIKELSKEGSVEELKVERE
jgi:hypothetical protein